MASAIYHADSADRASSDLRAPQSFAIESTDPVAYFADGLKIDVLAPIEDPQGTVLPLPDRLYIDPGLYQVHGKAYKVQKGGLYRFSSYTDQSNEQRIVYDGNFHRTVGSLGWLIAHGNRDDGLTNTDLYQKALHEKLVMSCGRTAVWVQDALSILGIKSRLVMGLTLEPWNAYDNGHTMLEVRQSDRTWVVYDIDNNRYFTTDGHQLSWRELTQRVTSKQNYDIHRLTSAPTLSVGSGSQQVDGFNFDFIGEYINNNLDEWYQRVLQVSFIQGADGMFYFTDEENRARAEAYSSSHVFKDLAEFNQMFYPELN